MVREARAADLPDLLRLYTQLGDNPYPPDAAPARAVWEEIQADKNHHVVVEEREGAVVSACVLVVVPNLTHGQRPYGLIENVVTREDCRGRGYGGGCLSFARELARRAGCYKIMLMTGSRSGSTWRFYERAGFNRLDKTAFVQWLP